MNFKENISNLKFAILISTKNRVEDLLFTLESCYELKSNDELQIVVFDDGSTDGTFEKVKQNFPNVILQRNEISKGYLYCRNKMLNETKAKYAISLDDDANFLSQNPLEEIENHFIKNPNCGLISFRIFWGIHLPITTNSKENSQRVKGFVGCGHVWKIEAWKKVPNYPEWFVFYGEEEFASYQLFKINQEIHYLPTVLVHHRVEVKSRKSNNDYSIRVRRSLASGWYLYFLFYPIKTIPRKIIYSLWIQLKTKTFKGDFKATKGIFKAVLDVIINIPKLVKQSNRLSNEEYQEILKLSLNKIYWKPEDEE